jgi:alanine racemase
VRPTPAPTTPWGKGVRVTRAEAVIDLAAISHNVRVLGERSRRPVMAVVKADGYGHGLSEAAVAARMGGASWLGVATLDEALAVRTSGDDGPLLCWLGVPGEDYAAAIRASIDVTAYTIGELSEIVAAARREERAARVQLKADTGLNRGGTTMADWPALVTAAARAEDQGFVRVTGVWSHLACADEVDHPSVKSQIDAFARAVDVADAAGLAPEVRHLANSPATIAHPDTWWDLVRPGLSIFGLSPIPDRATAADLWLVPAMTVRAHLALVKRAPAGAGVSYGHTYITSKETTLAVVPAGYADGIPRHASGVGPVLAAGRRRLIAGRVCMDQFVLDLGDDDAAAGDEVILFGPGREGEPTAQDWADAAGTISYEIVSRIGGRIHRSYVGGAG